MKSLEALLAVSSLSVAELDRIYGAWGKGPDFLSAAVSALRQLDPDRAWRAVWLMRRCARDQGFPEQEFARLASSIEEYTHWLARLTLCQLLAETGCPRAHREAVYPFLIESFSDRRVIVRAWAISALVKFEDDSRYRQNIRGLRRAANQDPAKSMQARLRHLAGAKSRRTHL